MYVFTRSARLGPGRTRDAMGWAIDITQKVNQIAELEFRLWTTVMSPGVGRLVWSTQAEDLEQLETAEAKLLADDGYVTVVDRGAEFGSGDAIDDQLVQVIHDASDPALDVQYVAVVNATAANGHFARAVEFGVEIAQAAHRLGGAPTSFGLATTGGYGQVQWISGYHTLADLQRSEEAVNSSAEFVELIDREAASVYLPGTSTQIIGRRLA